LKHCIDRMSALNSEGALQMSYLSSSLQNLVAADELGRLALAVNEWQRSFQRRAAGYCTGTGFASDFAFAERAAGD
jgi:hypothetical protein